MWDEEHARGVRRAIGAASGIGTAQGKNLRPVFTKRLVLLCTSISVCSRFKYYIWASFYVHHIVVVRNRLNEVFSIQRRFSLRFSHAASHLRSELDCCKNKGIVPALSLYADTIQASVNEIDNSLGRFLGANSHEDSNVS